MAGVAFEPGHKPDTILVQLVKPGRLGQRSTDAWLEAQVFEGLEVMGLAVGDQDALGQQPSKHGVASFRVLNWAQGKTAAHRSLVVASMILT